jgi:SAM-dependent methyltransferase
MSRESSFAFVEGWPGLLALIPFMRRCARSLADWVDLQGSITATQLASVAKAAHGKLLDVGCGSKPYESLFRPFVDQYVGIEKRDTFASTYSANAGSRCDLYYDGDRLPFPDESFDTVLNIQVLEHTPRPQELLDDMARVLRSDGLLILSAPFSFRLHEQPHDYFRFSPHGLVAMCERAGLEIIEMRSQRGLWGVIGHKLNTYLALRVGRLDRLGQVLGKLGHEARADGQLRIWALPLVVGGMVGVAAGARILDRALPDDTETLSYLLLARKRAPSLSIPHERTAVSSRH